MPGYSLWLVPHASSPFTKTAQELISETVPRIFVSDDSQINHFPPHVTVTSDIDATKVFGDKSPQAWLDSLQLPDFKAEHNEVVIELEELHAEEPFFRKCNIATKANANLTKLATVCRKDAVLGGDEAKAQAWARSEYRPHFSLFYGDIPTQQVKSKLPLIEIKLGFAIG
ncbi:hypothetical protein BAUCODRAFT_43864, partial [Baudoinia panamericana UAMH 10762]